MLIVAYDKPIYSTEGCYWKKGFSKIGDGTDLLGSLYRTQIICMYLYVYL